MKINKSLSRYILEENGNVFEKENGEQVEMINKTEYRLVTDEKFKSEKGKESNIVRRFTRDQIIKIYNSPDSVSIQKDNPKANVQEPQTSTSEAVKVSDQIQGSFDNPEGAKIQAEGKYFKSIGEASKVIGISYNTIKKRIEKGFEGYKNL